MIRKIIIFICFVICGQIQAQNPPVEGLFYENKEILSDGCISAPEPIELRIEHGELSMESDSNSAQPNSQFSILNSQLNKDPVIAWLISFPAGVLGLHRAYLGTDVKTVLLYIVTVGGFFGIVPMVDWILLLKGIQTGDISKYVGNRKFLMWL